MGRRTSARSTGATLVRVLVAVALLAVAAAAFAAVMHRNDAGSAASDGLALPESAPSAQQAPDAQRGAAAGEDAALPDAVIVQASQQVGVTDVAAAGRRLLAAVQTGGGYVSAENTSTGQPCPPVPLDTATVCGAEATSVITYRAPVDAVDALMDTAAGLGTELWRTRSATDVSTDVADVDARVTSARASLDRLNSLMAQAQSLSDVLALESQIASRQAELESLLARQRTLADQTALATVTTSFTAQAATQGSDGFVDGIRAGLNALADAARTALVVIGWLLPWLAVAALAFLPVRWFVKRRAKVGSDVGERQDSPA